MVRTGERSVRVAGGKSSQKKGGSSSSSTGSGPSTSSSSSASGGNPVCPRETPSWQKPITAFFPKKENHHQQVLKKEMAESNKTNIQNLETVPVVAGPSTDVQSISAEKQVDDKEKELDQEANDASNVEDTKENKFVETSKNSLDPISPSKDVNLDETDKSHDKKNESLLATPKSEKKQSSNDHLTPSEAGLENIAASRKRFGDDSGGARDDNEIPSKKLKLDDGLLKTPSEEAAGCSMATSSSDFSSATYTNGNDSDSSGFDEFTSRKRENPDSSSDVNNERPNKKLKLENAQPRYQVNEPASVYDERKSSSEDWSAVNDSGSEESINRRALRGMNSRGSLDGSISPSKISELDSSLLGIHIGDSASASINEDIIVVSSDEDDSDMELDNSISFSPENPYMYMNGNSEVVANNAVHAPPPLHLVLQGQNNPMDLGYVGNNDNNDNIPDNVYYHVLNGYQEDDGSLAGNHSDDDTQEDESETDTDIEDNDEDDDLGENEDEDEDDDDQNEDRVPFHSNFHFYHNHIEK